MQRVIILSLLLVLSACQGVSSPREQRVARSLVNVGGPELVFARPVAEIVPELEQATLAPERGRVGNELVFWAYDLPSGERRWLYACGVFPHFDCGERATRVCPGAAQTLLLERQEPGAVRRMNCQLVGQVAPGDLYPNCTDHTETLDVVVGLLSCGQ